MVSEGKDCIFCYFAFPSSEWCTAWLEGGSCPGKANQGSEFRDPYNNWNGQAVIISLAVRDPRANFLKVAQKKTRNARNISRKQASERCLWLTVGLVDELRLLQAHWSVNKRPLRKPMSSHKNYRVTSSHWLASSSQCRVTRIIESHIESLVGKLESMSSQMK